MKKFAVAMAVHRLVVCQAYLERPQTVFYTNRDWRMLFYRTHTNPAYEGALWPDESRLYQ